MRGESWWVRKMPAGVTGRSQAGDAFAGTRLLVEVLVLEQVQQRDTDLAAGAGGPGDGGEIRDHVGPGEEDRLSAGHPAPRRRPGGGRGGLGDPPRRGR